MGGRLFLQSYWLLFRLLLGFFFHHKGTSILIRWLFLDLAQFLNNTSGWNGLVFNHWANLHSHTLSYLLSLSMFSVLLLSMKQVLTTSINHSIHLISDGIQGYWERSLLICPFTAGGQIQDLNGASFINLCSFSVTGDPTHDLPHSEQTPYCQLIKVACLFWLGIW